MALGSTYPLTEIFPGGKGGRWVGLTNVPPLCADSPEIGEPQSSVALRACPDPTGMLCYVGHNVK